MRSKILENPTLVHTKKAKIRKLAPLEEQTELKHADFLTLFSILSRGFSKNFSKHSLFSTFT